MDLRLQWFSGSLRSVLSSVIGYVCAISLLGLGSSLSGKLYPLASTPHMFERENQKAVLAYMPKTP